MKYEMPDDKGETRRQRNEKFGKPELTEDIEIPDEGLHIWSWFWDLNVSRQQGFSGPNALLLTDIANWAGLTGEIIIREEISIIRAMDLVYLQKMAEEQKLSMERAQSK